MTADEIITKVIAVAAELLFVDQEEITLDSRLVEDLGADSTDLVELVLALEKEFERKIPEAEAEAFVTVRDVVTYCRSRGW